MTIYINLGGYVYFMKNMKMRKVEGGGGGGGGAVFITSEREVEGEGISS